jgi:hypothetical protein
LLEALLDRLERDLGEHLEKEPGRSEAFYRELTVLVDALAPEQLDSFERRKGTELETNLFEYLRRIGPRKSLGQDSLERAWNRAAAENKWGLLYGVNQ